MPLLPCPAILSIKSVRLYALRLPLRRPMHMAGSVIRETENLLVLLQGSDGSEGWGEAASAPTMTGETLPGMAAAAARLIPAMQNMSVAQLDEAQRRMGLALYGNTSVKSAFETAWLDLAGRALGRSVLSLLSTKRTEVTSFDLQWMLGSGKAESDIAEALEQHAAGFRVFKIKVGGDPQADAERTLAIARSLNGACLLSADANQAWSVADAVAYANALPPNTLAFLEQPVAADDLAGMAEVMHRTGLPLCSDEGIHCLRDLEAHHERRAAAGASLKPIKLGGLRATVAASARCSELGMQVNLSCKVAESGVSAAALLHVAAASPQITWGLSLSNQYLLHDLIKPLSMTQTVGSAVLPLGSGLGIEVDSDVLAAYATPVPV